MSISTATDARARLLRFRCSRTFMYAARRFSNPLRDRHVAAKFLFLALIATMTPDAQAQMRPGGQVVKDCWEKGGSHVAIVDCEAKERDRLKAEMMRRYDHIKNEARQADDDMEAIGSKVGRYQEEGVIDSQKAFDRYLEDECQRMMNIAGGGTAGADYHLGCEIDLIMQRMERLSSDSERNETERE